MSSLKFAGWGQVVFVHEMIRKGARCRRRRPGPRPAPTTLRRSWTARWSSTAAEATWDVSITAGGFEPQTVTIDLDDAVRWTNDDSTVHAVSGGQSHYRLYLPLLLRLTAGL
jgi:hypothetical protein